MKTLDDLILELQKLREENGNLPVVGFDEYSRSGGSLPEIDTFLIEEDDKKYIQIC